MSNLNIIRTHPEYRFTLWNTILNHSKISVKMVKAATRVKYLTGLSHREYQLMSNEFHRVFKDDFPEIERLVLPSLEYIVHYTKAMTQHMTLQKFESGSFMGVRRSVKDMLLTQLSHPKLEKFIKYRQSGPHLFLPIVVEFDGAEIGTKCYPNPETCFSLYNMGLSQMDPKIVSKDSRTLPIVIIQGDECPALFANPMEITHRELETISNFGIIHPRTFQYINVFIARIADSQGQQYVVGGRGATSPFMSPYNIGESKVLRDLKVHHPMDKDRRGCEVCTFVTFSPIAQLGECPRTGEI